MKTRITSMLAALCAGLFMLNSTPVSAQRSGDQVEAKIKKANQIYEYSVGNPAKNKKTDFVKMDEAKAIIEQVINSGYGNDYPWAWKVAADIMEEYYKKYAGNQSMNTACEYGYKFITYAIKADSSITSISSVVTDEDIQSDIQSIKARNCNRALSPLVSCLQKAQELSNSSSQADLALGKKYSELIIYALEKSSLFSAFTDESKPEWILYAKAFRAQCLVELNGSKADDVEAAYRALYGTQYESVAYSALLNYFRDRNKQKYDEILAYAAEHATGEAASQFAFMNIQNLYFNGRKEECIRQIDRFVEKYADDDRTVSVYLMKGQIYFEDKKFDMAENVFNIAARKYPNDERAITMPAKCAWMKAQSSDLKSDREHAISLFKELETKFPNNPDYWGEPLYILYNNNQQPQLRDKYKKYYGAE